MPWHGCALCWCVWSLWRCSEKNDLNALRFALRIISGKNILNFGFQESLRTFLKPIFTGGVVTENGICSAAFCESAALRAGDSSPLGELSRSD